MCHSTHTSAALVTAVPALAAAVVVAAPSPEAVGEPEVVGIVPPVPFPLSAALHHSGESSLISTGKQCHQNHFVSQGSLLHSRLRELRSEQMQL